MTSPALRSQLWNAALVLASYWLWLFLFHLVGMSLITYGMLDSNPGVQEIADQYFASFWTIQGWASLGFFLLLWGFSVVNPTGWSEMTASVWKSEVLPTFLKSAAAAAAFLTLLMVVSPFLNLGPGFSWTDAPWTALGWLARSTAWIGWALGDELVFRKLLLSRVRKLLRHLHPRGHSISDILAVALVTAIGVFTRAWRQHLGWSQTLTLTLLGLVLGLRVIKGRSYLTGAALVAGFAWVFQSLFGLPLLGHDGIGIWIIKFPSSIDDSLSWLRLLSGGAGGPASSALLQLFLAGTVLRFLWTPGRGSLR